MVQSEAFVAALNFFFCALVQAFKNREGYLCGCEQTLLFTRYEIKKIKNLKL